MKLWSILGVIAVILLVLYYIYGQGLKKGSQTQEIKNNEQIIKQKDIIIKEYENVKIRKVKNKLIPTNDNIEWLRQYRCVDCTSQ